MRVNIKGIGVRGPGIENWLSGRDAFAAQGDFPLGVSTELPPPATLGERERRRTGLAVRLALEVAAQACDGRDTGDLAAVFASSLGDGVLLDKLLRRLTTNNPKLSPTDFHNSVHNAAVGYWSIATGNGAGCASIAAHDATFGAGLLLAAAQTLSEDRDVLLVCFDAPMPEPLHAKRPMASAFAVALLLGPSEDQGRGRENVVLNIDSDESQRGRATPPSHHGFSELWRTNPAAAALPLLEALARSETDTPAHLVCLPNLRLTVGTQEAQPC